MKSGGLKVNTGGKKMNSNVKLLEKTHAYYIDIFFF